MGVKGCVLWVLIILFAAVLFTPGVLAQESEVCLVYFTGYACGEECRLTDSFMSGLMNEYSNVLTAITYFVDSSQENANIFEAYRRTYNLPSGVPLVLFGKDDYLLGKDNIYKNAEAKIYGFMTSNGTNCPLESGYVPPSNLNPGDLPGEAEVFERQRVEDEEMEDERETNESNVIPTPKKPGSEVNAGSVIETVTKSEYFPLWILAAAVFIILLVVIALGFGRK